MSIATRAGASPLSNESPKTRKVLVKQEGKQLLWWQRSFVAEIPADCDADYMKDELTELADEAGIEWEDVDEWDIEVADTRVDKANPEDKPDVTYTEPDEADEEAAGQGRPLHANSLVDRLSHLATDVESVVGSDAADELRAWADRWGGRHPSKGGTKPDTPTASA